MSIKHLAQGHVGWGWSGLATTPMMPGSGVKVTELPRPVQFADDDQAPAQPLSVPEDAFGPAIPSGDRSRARTHGVLWRYRTPRNGLTLSPLDQAQQALQQGPFGFYDLVGVASRLGSVAEAEALMAQWSVSSVHPLASDPWTLSISVERRLQNQWGRQLVLWMVAAQSGTPAEQSDALNGLILMARGVASMAPVAKGWTEAQQDFVNTMLMGVALVSLSSPQELFEALESHLTSEEDLHEVLAVARGLAPFTPLGFDADAKHSLDLIFSTDGENSIFNEVYFDQVFRPLARAYAELEAWGFESASTSWMDQLPLPWEAEARWDELLGQERQAFGLVWGGTGYAPLIGSHPSPSRASTDADRDPDGLKVF